MKKTYTQVPTGCPAGPAFVRCVRCASGTYGLPKAAALTTGLYAMWTAHRRVDRWIAISQAVADANRIALKAEPERVDIIPTFVPDDIAASARTPRFDLPKRAFLLFVGALGPHKGLKVLLEARKQLGDVPLVILGTPRADTPDLSGPGIYVHYNVPREEVMAAWGAAAVGVVPSVWPEPLGQVAIECLAAGTPAVVTGTGGLAEVVRDGVEGFVVPPDDVQALAGAIKRLLDDERLRARMGAAGSARAREFEVGRVLPRIIDSFGAALAYRRGSVVAA